MPSQSKAKSTATKTASTKSNKMDKRTAFATLKKVFLRNGYLKVKDEDQAENAGSQVYKKGYEVRLIPDTKQELSLIRKAIASMDLYVAKPFQKHNNTIQPIYGKEITLKFLAVKQKAAGL